MGRPGHGVVLKPALAVGFRPWGVTVAPQPSRLPRSGCRGAAGWAQGEPGAGTVPVEVSCAQSGARGAWNRITAFLVNCYFTYFSHLNGFRDYVRALPQDVVAEAPMLQRTLRSARMASARRAVVCVDAARSA